MSGFGKHTQATEKKTVITAWGRVRTPPPPF